MGKRSNDHARIPKDKYYTRDPRAVAALLPHLPPGARYIEPCAGAGHLIDHLALAGHVCIQALDIDPHRSDIAQGDALTAALVPDADLIITNPPWSRDVLHPMIARFAAHKPTWLLFDADWVHTEQVEAHGVFLRAIVSVGYRIKWIPGTQGGGMDNACWHLFDARGPASANVPFFPRRAAA